MKINYYDGKKINYLALALSIIEGVTPEVAFDYLEGEINSLTKGAGKLKGLTELDVKEMIRLYEEENILKKDIAEMYGITPTSVTRYIQGYGKRKTAYSGKRRMNFKGKEYPDKLIKEKLQEISDKINRKLKSREFEYYEDLPSYACIRHKYGGIKEAYKKLNIKVGEKLWRK